jgi:hypothetical protein
MRVPGSLYAYDGPGPAEATPGLKGTSINWFSAAFRNWAKSNW